MSLKKWKKEIKKVFSDEGCKIDDISQSKNHLKIRSELPLGRKIIFVTGITPSDRRAIANFRSDVRRAVRYERTNN